jgi:hypothetical protein
LINGAVFAPDGGRILTASYDNTARLWEAFPETQALIDRMKADVPRCLTPEQRQRLFLAPTALPRDAFVALCREVIPFVMTRRTSSGSALNAPTFAPLTIIAAKQLISQNKIDFLCGKCGVVDDVRG